MIKANELRIGNWVMEDGSLFSKITGMKPYSDSIRCDEEQGCDLLIDIYRNDVGVLSGYECESGLCSPIPLTPEILEKCGFDDLYESSCGHVDFADKHHCIYRTKDGFTFHPFCTNDKDCQIKIKYLHQLQNLIHALTGEELTVNL